MDIRIVKGPEVTGSIFMATGAPAQSGSPDWPERLEAQIVIYARIGGRDRRIYSWAYVNVCTSDRKIDHYGIAETDGDYVELLDLPWVEPEVQAFATLAIESWLDAGAPGFTLPNNGRISGPFDMEVGGTCYIVGSSLTDYSGLDLVVK